MSFSPPSDVSDRPRPKQESTRPHPPRLQHSPSLPNIWFPPHSGPLPPHCRKLAAIPREDLYLSATPSELMSKFPLPPSGPVDSSNANSEPLAINIQRAIEENFSLKNASLKGRPKHSRRHRVEHTHDHNLLTPPLTPSSSIRTTASIESAASSSGLCAGTDTGDHTLQLTGNEANFEESNATSTRFLLVGNVARAIPCDELNRLIFNSLSVHNLGLVGPLPNDNLSVQSPVVGIFARFQHQHGVVILAFYDIRYAQVAKQFLTTRSTQGLDRCVEYEPYNEKQRWLTCRFISPDRLVQLIGDSDFLRETTSNFRMVVDRLSGDESDDESPNSYDSELRTGKDPKRDAIKQLLSAFGELRSLNEVYDPELADHTLIFDVEFCDFRHSREAYRTLNGQTRQDMRFRMTGQEGLEESSAAGSRQSSEIDDSAPSLYYDDANTSPTSMFNTTCDEGEAVQPFGRAGQYSRERFVFPDVNGKATQDSTTVAVDKHINFSPAVADEVKSSSPTCFYTSPPSDARHAEAVEQADRRREHVNDHSSNLVQITKGMDELSLSHPPNAQPHYLCALPECYYIPNRDGPPIGQYFCPPVNIPSLPYVPPHIHSPNLVYPGAPPSPFEYDVHSGQPIPRMQAHWAFEQAMIENSAQYSNSALSSGHVAQEVWCPMATLPDTSPYTSLPPDSQGQHIPYAPASTIPQGNKPDSSSIYTQNSTRGSPHMKRNGPTLCNTSPTVNDKGTDRNQLTLEKIEQGVDTRTTVMIKNIPNKMSDKDLMTFIGKVCPRKIDFLYLRMDFNNGCNVGYAFVNFIYVQDLLNFAKKRLGQKWNMFSSEKVLQMSYANFQGKEALVEKFKNSCIMDECEAWQPKIFYSEPGPEQGLAEPFPAPTHLRRKERSSHNRSTLFSSPGPQSVSTVLHSSLYSRRRSDDDNHHIGGLIPSFSGKRLNRSQC